MSKLKARLVGVELYFDDLGRAKRFYEDTLGLSISGEQDGHHAQFNLGPAFLCVEQKGVEDFPSYDKAVIFLEVPSVEEAVRTLGSRTIVRFEPDAGDTRRPWAVLHDPEGHNVLLLERPPKAES